MSHYLTNNIIAAIDWRSQKITLRSYDGGLQCLRSLQIFVKVAFDDAKLTGIIFSKKLEER